MKTKLCTHRTPDIFYENKRNPFSHQILPIYPLQFLTLGLTVVVYECV